MEKLSKNKKAEVFGMSFGMIFSIILIVFFIIIAGIAVNAFLKWQKEAQIGLFIKELQNEAAIAFASPDYDNSGKPFKSSLPSGVEEVCFINMSSAIKDASNVEKMVYDYAKKQTHTASNNLFIYAPEKNYKTKWASVKKIDLSQKNPICIPVKNGAVSIKIKRTFDYPLLIVSA